MLNFFHSKELKACLKALDNSKNYLGQTMVLDRVSAIVSNKLKRSEKVIIDAVKGGMNPEVIAIAEVVNVSGDFVESGRLCIYRGVLSLEGQAMLNLHKAAYQKMVDIGACTAESAESEIAALMTNLSMVG